MTPEELRDVIAAHLRADGRIFMADAIKDDGRVTLAVEDDGNGLFFVTVEPA